MEPICRWDKWDKVAYSVTPPAEGEYDRYRIHVIEVEVDRSPVCLYDVFSTVSVLFLYYRRHSAMSSAQVVSSCITLEYFN